MEGTGEGAGRDPGIPEVEGKKPEAEEEEGLDPSKLKEVVSLRRTQSGTMKMASDIRDLLEKKKAEAEKAPKT